MYHFLQLAERIFSTEKDIDFLLLDPVVGILFEEEEEIIGEEISETDDGHEADDGTIPGGKEDDFI